MSDAPRMSDTREFPVDFSPTLGALAKALAKAQGELEDAKKDAINPHFKNKYASLSSVRAAITPAFSKNGLAVTQLNEPHGDAGVCVVTLLMHESGEWIQSKLFVPATKRDAQGFGSALSYARRYALAAIANIATDDDDDGNEAVKPTPIKSAPAPSSAPAAKSDIDVASLIKALDEARNAKELGAASLAVGHVADNLSQADRDRCRAAHDNTLRRLEKAA
jgi:hypothetical protein